MVTIKINENSTKKRTQKVRHYFDQKDQKWHFSIVDVIENLTDSSDARNYWKVLKNRLKNAQNQLVTKCNQLKMKAADGKYYLTDTADTETMLEIIDSIPKAKVDAFMALAEEIKNAPSPAEIETQNEENYYNGSEAKLLVDARETKNSIHITAMIAGVDPENISIYVEDEKIIISGKREKENYFEHGTKNHPKEYLIEELAWVSFVRAIPLPCPIEKSKIKTTSDNGVLEIELIKCRS